MRIGIQTWGSEGDIRPFLALGGGLARAGHEVTAVITDLDDRTYEAYQRTLGIRVRMVGRPGPSRQAELNRLGHELIRRNPFEQGKLIAARLFEPVVPEMFDAARQLCSEVDLVVGHFFHHPVRTAAEAAGVPEVSVTFSPDLIASANYPPTGIPSLGRWWNRAWWRIAQRMMDRAFLPAINRLRQSVQLRPLTSIDDGWHSRLLDLVAASPSLHAEQPDWSPNHKVTGFFVLPSAQEIDPIPGDVEEFLQSGAPPIFVGFGSLTPKETQEREDLRGILESALEAAGCRGIIQGLSPVAKGTARTLHVQRLSHAGVFPRCAAVVYHGGAGTTQSVLRAGVPSVVVPHVADQFYWGTLLHRRGVASAPIPRLKLTAARLADRIRAAQSPEKLANARVLRDKVASENGVRKAVQLIEHLARERG